MGEVRYCVKCGTQFEVEIGRGRPPIYCPEHRVVPREQRRPRIRTCPECGVEFADERRGKRPYVYCPEHRGTINSSRRSQAKHGYSKRPYQFDRRPEHVCDERCEIIKAHISKEYPPTLEEIGLELHITRERVRQLIARHGWKKTYAVKPVVCERCGVTRSNTVAGRKEHFNSIVHIRASEEHKRAHFDSMRNWNLGAMIYALFKTGEYSNNEIAYLANTQVIAVYRWLNFLGENPYTQGPFNRVGPSEAELRDPQIALQWEMGVSTEVIMETFGLKHGNLVRIIKEQGARRPAWYLKEQNIERGRKMAEGRRQARLARMSDNA